MDESKAIARKLVAQSIKPLVDELDEEVRRKGASKERAILDEVNRPGFSKHIRAC